MRYSSEEFQERFQRHLSLPIIGKEGQMRLSGTAVLLVGVGGLGSVLAPYLAALGIGKIRMLDADKVSLSNLQRQILYRTSDLGQAKVEIARRELQNLNPHVEIEAFAENFTADNALHYAKGIDIILDGSDNAQVRYLMNDVSLGLGIPYLYASVSDFQGQLALFNARPDSASYRCLYPASSKIARNAYSDSVQNSNPGVIGCLPGLLACLQINELVKWVCQTENTLDSRLFHIDLLTLQSRQFKIPPSPEARKLGLEGFRYLRDSTGN